MGTSATRKFEVVDTVNTRLNNEYDYGVHAAGCQDVKRAVARYGCRVSKVAAVDADAVVAAEREDLVDGGFEAGQAALFAFRVFPCCAKGGA